MADANGLDGPYSLDKSIIQKVVTQTSAGVYALGQASGGTFYISYVGRSDDDLADRLADHVGNYHQFKAAYQGSPKAAFLMECQLYHDFNPPDNKIHPDRPKNANWECPRCTIFD